MFESTIELKSADHPEQVVVKKTIQTVYPRYYPAGAVQKEPCNIVVLHGGPGAAGSALGLTRLISKEFGVLEPMQSKYTFMEMDYFNRMWSSG